MFPNFAQLQTSPLLIL